DGAPCLLPIDAKFPLADYQQLVDAQERADPVAVELFAKALERRIKDQAADIHAKYVEPPHTTDFALLYLPVEGLYAEVLRRPGLADLIQRECQVTLAGPTTLGQYSTACKWVSGRWRSNSAPKRCEIGRASCRERV